VAERRHARKAGKLPSPSDSKAKSAAAPRTALRLQRPKTQGKVAPANRTACKYLAISLERVTRTHRRPGMVHP
jgi:hypothetical protein